MRVQRDIVYNPDSERGILDLYLPDSEGPYPVVLAIHGGSWRQGDKSNMKEFAAALLGTGIACVAPNYRLTGTDPHPAQQNDILAVLDWIAAHAAEYGFDPYRIGVTGSSAGAHLTSLVTIKASRSEPDGNERPYTIRCMLPICGDAHDFRYRIGVTTARLDVVEALLGGPIPDRMDIVPDLSPIEHVHQGVPPCMAVHGSEDKAVPLEQSERLVRALRDAGCEADLLVVPDAGHGRYHPDTNPPEPLGGAEVFRAFFLQHLCAE